LPDIGGLHGLDVGCGEGYNTRLVAEQGACITAFDTSPRFVRAAQEMNVAKNYLIEYCLASAIQIPFHNQEKDKVWR
jgi:2-polyprenyl-3-methyl-5-hydroxy-6-metoxy-1,4-benzoquinol methylase